MILNTTSFKNVKRNEQFLKNKKIKTNKKNILQKSNSDHNIITIKISENNKYKPSLNLKTHDFIRSNTNSNIYTLKDNINDIILNLKQQNKKIEQSTDISSNINTNTYNVSKINSITKTHKTYKTNKVYKGNNIKLKRGKSVMKIKSKAFESLNYSILLKNQEKIILAKGKNRNARSSIHMPYIHKDNKNLKKYKYVGLYNTKLEKDTSLKEEINTLMTKNQKIKTEQKKSRSFSFKNNNVSKTLNTKTNFNPIMSNNKIFRGKTLNIKIKFSYQKKKR